MSQDPGPGPGPAAAAATALAASLLPPPAPTPAAAAAVAAPAPYQSGSEQRAEAKAGWERRVAEEAAERARQDAATAARVEAWSQEAEAAKAEAPARAAAAAPAAAASEPERPAKRRRGKKKQEPEGPKLRYGKPIPQKVHRLQRNVAKRSYNDLDSQYQSDAEEEELEHEEEYEEEEEEAEGIGLYLHAKTFGNLPPRGKHLDLLVPLHKHWLAAGQLEPDLMRQLVREGVVTPAQLEAVGIPKRKPPKKKKAPAAPEPNAYARKFATKKRAPPPNDPAANVNPEFLMKLAKAGVIKLDGVEPDSPAPRKKLRYRRCGECHTCLNPRLKKACINKIVIEVPEDGAEAEGPAAAPAPAAPAAPAEATAPAAAAAPAPKQQKILLKRMDELRDELRGKTKEIDELRGKTKEIDELRGKAKEIDELRGKLQQTKWKNSGLERRICDVLAENGDLRRELAEQEKHNADLLAQIQDIRKILV